MHREEGEAIVKLGVKSRASDKASVFSSGEVEDIPTIGVRGEPLLLVFGFFRRSQREAPRGNAELSCMVVFWAGRKAEP